MFLGKFTNIFFRTVWKRDILNDMHLIVYCDGGARGNPGPAGIGVFIKDEKGNVLSQFGKKIGVATNNIAEYTAVIEALSWITDNVKPSQITFRLDSQLVVYQLNGLYKMKSANLRELMVKVRELEARIGAPVSYQHVPREQNWEADSFVNKALDEAG